MRILGHVAVREGSDRFERRGQGRLLLHQDAITLYHRMRKQQLVQLKTGKLPRYAYLQRGGLS